MNIKIENIADIFVGRANGVYKREGVAESDPLLLQGADISKDGEMTTKNMIRVKITSTRNLDPYFLKPNDVVILSRGSSIRACYIDKEIGNAKVLASANTIIIRTNKEKIRGEVLAAYFNSEVGKDSLQASSTGAVIHHIPASVLRNIEIPLPSKQKQDNIAELFYAGREAYKSTLTLAEQQKKTVEAKMIDLMQGAES